MKIVFIHGYESSGSGTTASNIKKIFKSHQAIAPNFDLVNFEKLWMR